jgi:hypothetical protein
MIPFWPDPFWYATRWYGRRAPLRDPATTSRSHASSHRKECPMTSSVTFHRDRVRPRFVLRTDLSLIVAILILGLALAGLAAVALPLGKDLTTGPYLVD